MLILSILIVVNLEFRMKGFNLCFYTPVSLSLDVRIGRIDHSSIMVLPQTLVMLCGLQLLDVSHGRSVGRLELDIT